MTNPTVLEFEKISHISGNKIVVILIVLEFSKFFYRKIIAKPMLLKIGKFPNSSSEKI